MVIDPLKVERNGQPANLHGLWKPCPAFLIGSGKSIGNHNLNWMNQRGIVSLAINNTAAKVPARAWCFSDPQSKFHHALFLDPVIMTFAPIPKLRKSIIVKTKDGFRSTTIRVSDCPNTYGFARTTKFDPDTFFSDSQAHWGSGKHQPPDVEGSGCLATLWLGIRLLHYLGVRRIYLLGVDHYGSRRRWAKEVRVFERLLPVLAAHGIEIYNCNPDSECEVFTFVPYPEAILDCKGSIRGEPLDTEGWYNKSQVNEERKKHKYFVPVHFEEKNNE